MVSQRYEDLRAAVLGGRDAGWRHGWAVLARAGMAAWTNAVTAFKSAPGIVRPVGSGPDTAPPTGGSDAELVHVLAGLVLGQLRPP